MATEAYEYRKRFFYSHNPLTVTFRCRPCNAYQELPIIELMDKLTVTCNVAHCKTTYQLDKYRLTWAFLSVKGARPVAYPEIRRYSQYQRYINYHLENANEKTI